MIFKKFRILQICLLMLSFSFFLSGCWDSKEINTLLIVTGVAIDKSEEEGKVDITLQVGKNNQQVPSGGGQMSSASGEGAVLMLKVTSSTIMQGIMKLNRNNSRKILLHHNQILLIGKELAEQGIKKYIDFFIRESQCRLEVPVAVVDGNAGEMLSAKVEPEKISGVFLGHLFEDLSNTSLKARVRVLDLVSRMLEKTVAPILPIMELKEKEVEVEGEQGEKEEKEILIKGMAIFKEDKMITVFDVDDFNAYIWTLGNVELCNLEILDSKGTVVLNIARLDSNPTIELLPDGNISLDFSINVEASISELQGFEYMEPKELIDYIIKIFTESLEERITQTFKKAQDFSSDIYKIGPMVYRKYTRQWSTLKDNWEEIFSNIELKVQVKSKILGTGHIVQSLEMEENADDN